MFKSQYSDHFRISEKFDVPGSMSVNIDLLDGYTNQAATAKLELMKRGISKKIISEVLALGEGVSDYDKLKKAIKYENRNLLFRETCYILIKL